MKRMNKNESNKGKAKLKCPKKKVLKRVKEIIHDVMKIWETV